jgi:S-adenosylmethionine hydrolase
MRPIVALLTDFGERDSYVAAVKGAVLCACPEATLVDIVHDLPPHDVVEGAFVLAAAVPAFPAGTVFVAVVDPGVGTPRRGLGIEAGGYRFVGPDNGIFSPVLAERSPARIRALTNRGLHRHEVSETFHGRDVFGPVAGHLARGVPLEELGGEVSDPVRLPERRVHRSGSEWEGEVVHADRFGNLVTNISRSDLEGILGEVDGDPNAVVVVVGGVPLPLARTYADVSPGEPCALLGSSGRLELSVNQGSAALRFAARRGTPLRVRPLRPPRP